MDRRMFMGAVGAGAGVMILSGCAQATKPAKPVDGEKSLLFGDTAFRDTIAAIDRDSGGRLGVAVHDTGTGARFAWRGDERFAMCSTFKFLLAAAVLQQVDRGKERLDRTIAVTAADIIPNSKASEAFVGGPPATVALLCEATMIHSDNTAANLLLPAVGGPAGLTAMLRAWGDSVTQVDRNEPSMNSAIPGDPRDTTSPVAMAETMQRLLLGDVLSPASRARLTAWLVDNRTGGLRLRAGLPKDWGVGDKTGTGDTNANDIAILWPPKRAPIFLTSYIAESPLDMPRWGKLHARVAAAVAGVVAPL